MSKPEDKQVAVNAEDLKDILSSVLAEARKPVVTEAERKAEAERLAGRELQRAQLKEQMENEIAFQNACTHFHGGSAQSHAAYVQNGNFIICQRCQKIIRPETDAALFNRLLQSIAPAVF